jgi:hypothetical protein
MDHKNKTPQQSTSHMTPARMTPALMAGLGVTLVSMPAHAQSVLATVTTVAGSAWITATIVSVSTVVALWVATVILSGVARRLRWVTPHRHSRLARGVQVVFGGFLLLAMMMPYLAMNYPVVAAGLVATVLCATIVISSRNRQFSGESG